MNFHEVKRYLGIDFGDARIGLALADDAGLALPYTIIDNDRKLWDTLATLIRSEAITDIVVGWPLSMSGAENERTKKTSEFIEQLTQRFQQPVHTADERLSTAAARRDVSGRVDAQAAAHILQTYLDTHAINDSSS